jgi:hypothetical protein
MPNPAAHCSLLKHELIDGNKTSKPEFRSVAPPETTSKQQDQPAMYLLKDRNQILFLRTQQSIV